MDGLTGRMVWEVPLESLTGFEHEAKSAADKKKVAGAQPTIREKLGEMVLFPPAPDCKVSVTEVEVEQHSEHSEMHSQATVTCKHTGSEDVVWPDCGEGIEYIFRRAEALVGVRFRQPELRLAITASRILSSD